MDNGLGDQTMIEKITIQKNHLSEMIQSINADLPNESCGLLAGSKNQSLKVFPITNILKNPVRYQMDPEQQIKALIEIEENDFDLLAIYHSHPAGPAIPSLTDVAEAMYPESVFLIFSPGSDQWNFRGFMIQQGDVQEVQISVIG